MIQFIRNLFPATVVELPRANRTRGLAPWPGATELPALSPKTVARVRALHMIHAMPRSALH